MGMNMPPHLPRQNGMKAGRGLRFFAVGSTKIPLLTELKMMNAIPANEFPHDVFLSHSSKDKAVVRPLAERLRADGLRVCLDDWEIRPGGSISPKIEEGLENSRALSKCAANVTKTSLGVVIAADLKV
jgi:hypothetical protein